MFKLNKTICDKIDGHYSESNRKVVKCYLRWILKEMNIEDCDLNKVLRNDGLDFIECIKKREKARSTCMYNVIGVLKLFDIETPDSIRDVANKFHTESRKRVFAEKKEEQVNYDFDICKVQKFFHDRLYIPKTKYSKKISESGEIIRVPYGKPIIKPSKSKWSRLALFTILKRVPLRLETIGKLSFEDNDKNNVIDLEKKIMIIRDSKDNKMKKKASIRKIPFDDEFAQIMTDLKAFTGSSDVFPAFRGGDKVSISKIFMNAMKFYCKENDLEYSGKKYGIHMLRSIAATADCKDKITLNCTVDELEAILHNAHERGHSISTVLQHYVRKS